MSTASSTPRSSRSRRDQSGLSGPIIGVVVAIVLIGVGYSLSQRRTNEQLPSAYGKRRGAANVKSVSGTVVLSDMFRKAGHRVSTFTRFSPRLNDADIIVWAPDDFAPPTKEQRDFLEQWLARGGKTLVYIGRDYDAASAYWQKTKPNVKPEDAEEYQRQYARAKALHEKARAEMPEKQYARWFTARRDAAPRRIRSLDGPWSDGINDSAIDVWLEGRLDVPKSADAAATDPPLPGYFEPLLESKGDVLAFRVEDDAWLDSQIIVVANGSFVLNYPLANHEHRRLAGRLVNEIEIPGRAVFIESGPGGPEVLDKEPSSGIASPLDFLKIWPLNVILIHLTVLGIIFCLARSPIFGRPRELPAAPAADFGRHVEALGELLARTNDRNYALARLTQYRQIGKRESGKSHLKGK